jgi:hypothetical protein
MKAVVLLSLVLVFCYFTWNASTSREKTTLLRRVRRHAVPLSLIALVVLSGIWVAVNFASLQVL